MENLKHYEEKKIPVNFKITAKENQNIEITISDNKHTITKTGTKVQSSLTSPITKENIT